MLKKLFSDILFGDDATSDKPSTTSDQPAEMDFSNEVRKCQFMITFFSLDN